MKISANLIDIRQRRIYPVTIHFSDGLIQSIEPLDEVQSTYILPGFIDAHVHIESSMLVPTEFGKMAVVHGTVGTVSDPHEIANVMGKEGVYYMIENGKKSPLKFHFGAPSCVPATAFETAGAEITPDDIDELLSSPDIFYLAEMMNWPGVLYEDPMVMEKLRIAQKHRKPIDGHAPGLMGDQALNYISKGISTDHECYMYEEALFKLQNGMKVIIREGSAAKNFETLAPLISDWWEKMMFCSDDKHPDDLELGHINLLVKRALDKGHDLYKVLQMACLNPVTHYRLPVGTLQAGEPADFIRIDDPTSFNILETWINGEMVASGGKNLVKTAPERIINQFNVGLKNPADFQIKLSDHAVRVIEVRDGQLITDQGRGQVILDNEGFAHSDPSQDLLKLVVVNRYAEAPVAVAFIRNVGLKKGAFASTVAHDSHNIISVGVDDDSICQAVNALITHRGGLSVSDGTEESVLPLPVAGLMSEKDGHLIAAQYTELVRKVKKLGSTLTSPYMSLSFMALLVIPSLKLSDKGLFDGEKFVFTDVLLKNN